MHKKEELPAMPFYWGDWFKSPDVQSLPRETKCVWFEMLGRMWESTERGYLTINYKPMADFAKARALGFGDDVDGYLKHENILEDMGIFSRRDKDNAIYSRKILYLNDLREKRKIAGSLGGKQTQSKTQAKGQASPENENENVIEVINLFNNICETNFRHTLANKKVIGARLNEGHTVADCVTVITRKYDQWKADPEMSKYIRIETLFRPSKFEGYLNEKDVAPVEPEEKIDAKAIDNMIYKELKNMATDPMIKKVLEKIPQKGWWLVRRFLKKQFPNGGEKAFYRVEAELSRGKAYA